MSSNAEQPDEGADFSRLIRSSLGWSFANNAIERTATLATGIVLAHILSPRDFGVYAVALTAMLFMMAINDAGLSQALVRWPGSLDPIGPTSTTLILGFSTFLCAVFMVAAGPFADAMGTPSAAGVVRLMSLALVVDGIAAVPNAAITRGLLQNRRAVAEFVGFAIGTPLTIVLAVAGYGPWSLAWGSLAGNVATAAVLIAIAPARYRPGFDRGQAPELLRHGVPLAAATLVGFGLLNADYFVVGNILGPIALGLYVFAFNLSSWPVNVFVSAIRRVSLAGFSRLRENPAALRSGFSRSFALTTAASVPMCVLLAAFAPQLVNFVYGPQWAGAITALRLLALLGGIRVVLDFSWDLLVAVGRSRLMVALHGLWLVALVPALITGAELNGINGVGAAHLAVAAIIVVPCYLVALSRVGIHIGDLSRPLLRPLVGAFAIAVLAFATTQLVEGTFATLAVGGSVCFLTYLVIISPMRHLARATRPEGPAGEAPAVS